MRTLLFLPLLLACGDKEQTDTSTEDTSIEDTTPTRPDSIVLETSGSENLSLIFDNPTCQIPSAAANFNTFWRNGTYITHVFVLRVMLRGDYVGPGTYDTTNDSLLVTLQKRHSRDDIMRWMQHKEIPLALSSKQIHLIEISYTEP